MNPEEPIDLELNTAEARQAVTDWLNLALDLDGNRARWSWWVLVNPHPGPKGLRWCVFYRDNAEPEMWVRRSDLADPVAPRRSLEGCRRLWAMGIAEGLVPVTIRIP